MDGQEKKREKKRRRKKKNGVGYRVAAQLKIRFETLKLLITGNIPFLAPSMTTIASFLFFSIRTECQVLSSSL